MEVTKKLFLLLLIAISSLCNGQNLEEGALVVLLKEEYANTNFHTVGKANGRETYKFQHPVGKKIFDKYVITKLERTYPGIENYNHPNVKILSRYYTIRGNFKRDRAMISVIEDGGDFFEDVEPLAVDVPLYTTNDFNLEPFSQKHLEMIKAKEAWDITKGDRAVKIAVTDPRGFFFGHPDYVNSNGTNQIFYRSPQAGDQDLGSAHGLQVASCVAIATDNGKGISAIGFNTSLMAFNSGLTQMLSASYDYGAPVVEASWFNSCNFRTSDQLIIDMIYDNGTTIIVGA
ncbi:MAG: hypothetical protein O9262_10440, partial [Cyclobacteriaceae bacterium]|nr:hypothetical protein [Cyclobacteriaceae bacterium]